MNPKNAKIYGLAIFFSKCGVGLFFFINTWIVIHLANNESAAAISLLIAVTPSIFFSLIIGRIADNSSAITLIKYTEFFRFSLLAIYASLYHYGYASTVYAYAFSFFMAIASETQLMAWRVVIAKNTTGEVTLRVNALTVKCGQAGVVVGAAISGLLFHSQGATITIAFTSVMFILSFLLISNIALQTPKSEEKVGTKTHTKAIKLSGTIGAGLKYIWVNPDLFGHYLLILVNINILYFSNAVLAPFVKNALGFDARAYGYIDASFSVGAIAGAYLAIELSKRLAERTIIILGLIIQTISLMVFSLSTTLFVAVLAYTGIGLACQTSIINLTSAQHITHANMHGRVYATFNMLTGIFGILVFILSSHLTTAQDSRLLFQTMSLATATLVTFIAISRRAKKLLTANKI